MNLGSLIHLMIIILCFFAFCHVGICNSTIKLDAAGVPIIDYGFVSPKGESVTAEEEGWTYIGKQRNPLLVSSQGLIYYDQYLNGNNSSKDLLLNCSDWFIDNVETRNGSLVWVYKHAWPTYNNTPNFISGMAQSGAVRILAIAYNLTGEEKYIQTAKGGLGAFFNEVDEGGVTYKDKDGWWYEEYAQPNLGMEPRVLNGHMAVLINLREYYNLTRDSNAKDLFNLGVSDLRANLKSYDTGNWSKYDLAGNNAVWKYHEIHINQLGQIYNITGDFYFKNYRNSWIYYELAAIEEYNANIDKSIGNLRLYQAGLAKKISDLENMLFEGDKEVN